MNNSENNSLKVKIIEEMLTDDSNALERNFRQAKKFIKITREGKIDILFKNQLSGEDKICLYLIGKVYAKEAELSMTIEVKAKELMNELGIVKGSFYPMIKRLRDKNSINQSKQGKYIYFSIPSNQIERVLFRLIKKLKLKG